MLVLHIHFFFYNFFSMNAGIIRHIQHGPDNVIALVPGDVVSSTALVATASTAVRVGKRYFNSLTVVIY